MSEKRVHYTQENDKYWTVIRKYVGYETIERYFNVPHENKALNLAPGNILQRWRQSRGIFWSKNWKAFFVGRLEV